MDIHETFLHDGVHRRTAADEIPQLAAESITQTFLDTALENRADDRCMPEHANNPFAEQRIEVLFVNLLYDKRHGNHQVRLHVA